MPHRNSVMTVTLLISFFRHGDCDLSDATYSDEDRVLKEALLLVEILKSEYSKVLQENNDLRSGTNTIAELSTCPTTKASNSTILLLNMTTNILPSPKTPVHAKPGAPENLLNHWSPPPFYRRNARNRRRFLPRYYRRYMNMPMDYYYYDLEDKFRRFSYEDQFGAHPNETDPTSVMTSKNTDTKTSVVTATSIETKIIKSTTMSILPQSTGTSSRTKTISSKKRNIAAFSSEVIQKLNLMQPVPHEHMTTTADPVISQVASELIHEFGSRHSSFPPKHINMINHLNKAIKIGATADWWRQLKLPRTTLRIYLSGSTKFPIPYPDNHSFCYTNPENALCRTMIK